MKKKENESKKFAFSCCIRNIHLPIFRSTLNDKSRENQIIVQYGRTWTKFGSSFAYSLYFIFFYAVQPTQIFTTHIFFPTCNSTRFFFSSACFFPIHSFPISNFTRSLFFNVCLICIIESIFYEGNIFYFQIWMHRVSERTGKKTCTLLVRFNLKIED